MAKNSLFISDAEYLFAKMTALFEMSSKRGFQDIVTISSYDGYKNIIIGTYLFHVI